MASKKKKEKRRQRQREKQKASRAHKGSFGDFLVVDSLPGEAKMSEVLLEFIEPYGNTCGSEEEFKKLIGLGAVAWNAAFYSGGEREQFLQEMMATIPPEARQAMRALVDEMIRRKETYFAGNTRVIVDYQVTMTPNGPHLSVMSTFGKT